MKYSENSYHTCKLLYSKWDSREFQCVCAYYYDMSDPLFSFEVIMDKETGKIFTIGERSLPDIYQEKMSMVGTKEKVPKNCPKGYTFEEIECMMFRLEKIAIIEREAHEEMEKRRDLDRLIRMIDARKWFR